MNQISFRPLEADDINFLYNSWLQSYRAAPSARPMTNDVYFATQKAIIHNCLQRGNVLLAVDTEDPSSIFGYICYEPQLVHFIYVKYPFRKLGIAKKLFAEAQIDLTNPIIVTHWTFASQQYQQKSNNLIYNPLLAMTKETNDEL